MDIRESHHIYTWLSGFVSNEVGMKMGERVWGMHSLEKLPLLPWHTEKESITFEIFKIF